MSWNGRLKIQESNQQHNCDNKKYLDVKKKKIASK